uniref:Dolichyl-diphosphooligosaccharide--protein glycosyltransferase subunit 1 n=1 Tax=Clastoptera arizonana TaxID=38151 RepID=A0A1B6CPK1_9HEMI
MFSKHSMYFLIWALIFQFCSGALSDSVNSGIVIKNVDRSIDISTQLVEITTKLTIENNNKVAINSFIYSVEPQFENNVAYIAAQLADFSKANLKVNVVTEKENKYWKIDLKESLEPKKDCNC